MYFARLVPWSLSFSRVSDLLLSFFSLDTLVYFLTMHGHFPGCVDAYSDLVSLHTENGNRYLVPDH